MPDQLNFLLWESGRPRDKGEAIDVICLHFTEASNSVLHSILISGLERLVYAILLLGRRINAKTLPQQDGYLYLRIEACFKGWKRHQWLGNSDARDFLITSIMNHSMSLSLGLSFTFYKMGGFGELISKSTYSFKLV